MNWNESDEIVHILDDIAIGAFEMSKTAPKTIKDTVYAPMTKQELGTFTITVTWDAGDVHLGYIWMAGQRRNVGWNYETRIWIVD